jgi:hypothetical protein
MLERHRADTSPVFQLFDLSTWRKSAFFRPLSTLFLEKTETTRLTCFYVGTCDIFTGLEFSPHVSGNPPVYQFDALITRFMIDFDTVVPCRRRRKNCIPSSWIVRYTLPPARGLRAPGGVAFWKIGCWT